MSLILCMEAGTDVGSVALARDGKLLSLRENTTGRQHAQNLAMYVQEVLREHEVDPSELTAVAIGRGPGSYTGLRICTSLAKGLCYGADIPLIAVNSLEALTRVALEEFEAGILDCDTLEDTTLMPMIDARRMEVYCQPFDIAARSLAPVEAHILTPESFLNIRSAGRLMLFGDGAAKCAEIFGDDPQVFIEEVVPSARGLVKPAFEALEKGQFEDIAYFEPFYLKDFVVTKSLKKIF